MPAFERHVFVCHNTRPAEAPRPSCTADGKSELHTRLQQLSRAAGLADKVRINKSGCLDQCEHGPTVVVYPDAVWYGNVQPDDAAAIVEELELRPPGGAAAPCRGVREYQELPAQNVTGSRRCTDGGPMRYSDR